MQPGLQQQIDHSHCRLQLALSRADARQSISPGSKAGIATSVSIDDTPEFASYLQVTQASTHLDLFPFLCKAVASYLAKGLDKIARIADLFQWGHAAAARPRRDSFSFRP
jgi:hypothetical protein